MNEATAIGIRPARRADADSIERIYGAVVTGSAASFEEEPPDRAEVLRRMSARPRMPWLVAQVRQQVVGYAAARPHHPRAAYRWAAESTVHLAPAHRGRGIGRALYERLIAEVGELGYVHLVAAIAMPNEASIRLHERLGFRRVGTFEAIGFKHGSWHGVSWWSLQLPAALPPDPQTPREWGVPDDAPTSERTN